MSCLVSPVFPLKSFVMLMALQAPDDESIWFEILSDKQIQSGYNTCIFHSSWANQDYWSKSSAKVFSHSCFAEVHCIEQPPSLWIFAIESIFHTRILIKAKNTKRSSLQRIIECDCGILWQIWWKEMCPPPFVLTRCGAAWLWQPLLLFYIGWRSFGTRENSTH